MKQRKCIAVLRNDLTENLTENLTHLLKFFQCTLCHPLHMADCPKACATPTNSNARVSSKVNEMHVRHTLRIHTCTWCTYLQCMQRTYTDTCVETSTHLKVSNEHSIRVCFWYSRFEQPVSRPKIARVY